MSDSWLTRLDVAWGDMDAFGHVNNARYFTYFEIARILWFQAKGVMADGLRVGEVGPILASTSCRFKAPVTFPDTLEIAVEVVDIGEDRFSHLYTVKSEVLGRVAATGEGLIVAYNYGSGVKAPLPPSWNIHSDPLD
jgi:acyl-CoA thioester hydrolase